MKKLIISLLSLLPFLSKAQTPTWFNSPADATIFVTKAERYLGITLLAEKNHQPGTHYYYRDNTLNTFVKLTVDTKKTGDKLKMITITGEAEGIQKMFDEYLKQLPGVESGKAYVSGTGFLANIKSDTDFTNHTKKDGKTITILSL